MSDVNEDYYYIISELVDIADNMSKIIKKLSDRIDRLAYEIHRINWEIIDIEETIKKSKQ